MPDRATIPWYTGPPIQPGSKQVKSFLFANQTGGFAQLATPQWTGVGALGVAYDANFLYWCDGADGHIWRVPRDGSAAPAIICNAVHGLAQDLYVDGTFIYVCDLNGNVVNQFDINGNLVNANFITLLGSGGVPGAIRPDPTNTFFIIGSPNGNNTGWIVKAPYTGGSGSNYINTQTAGGSAFIAVDSSFVFWTNTRTNKIGRANLDGSGVNIGFLSPAFTAEGIASDGTLLYVLDNAGAIRSIPIANTLAGFTQQTPGSIFNGPRNLVLVTK